MNLTLSYIFMDEHSHKRNGILGLHSELYHLSCLSNSGEACIATGCSNTYFDQVSLSRLCEHCVTENVGIGKPVAMRSFTSVAMIALVLCKPP